jgi:hypothetical protein
MQVNLALKGLPRFRCLPEAHGQHRTTTHLLPDEHAPCMNINAKLTSTTCCAVCCLLLMMLFQVNLELKGLPRFRCLPDARGQHRTTTHLLPDEQHVMQSLTQGFADVQAGRLPDFPTIEWRG